MPQFLLKAEVFGLRSMAEFCELMNTLLRKSPIPWGICDIVTRSYFTYGLMWHRFNSPDRGSRLRVAYRLTIPVV
jgi:hypothetical protein